MTSNELLKNLSKNYSYTTDTFLQMKMYILNLESNLKNKESEIDELKKLIVDYKKEKLLTQSKIENKETLLKEQSTTIKNQKENITSLEIKVSDLEKKNLNMNYKIIELEQENKILKDNISFYDVTINNDKTNIKDYILKIEKLSNKIIELEIHKNKLEFEKNHLENKIDEINNQNEIEKKLIATNTKNEISQYKKIINNLEESLSEFDYDKTNININNLNNLNNSPNNLPSDYLLEQLTVMENKNKKLNNINFNLEKEKQDLLSMNSELKTKLNYDDNLITSLKNEINTSINNYKNKLNDVQISTEENIEQMKENQNQILNLIMERDNLKIQNEELVNSCSFFKKSIDEANQIVSQKFNEFELCINKYKESNSNYKKKVQILKTKINELYSQIDLLKRNLYNEIQDINYPEGINNTQGGAMDRLNKSLNNLRNEKKFINSSNKNELLKLNNHNNLIKDREINYRKKAEVKDKFDDMQKKSLEEYRKVLSIVDENLKKYKNIN